MLYSCRYEIVSSEMMEQNMDEIQLHINKEFAIEDKYDTGEITI